MDLPSNNLSEASAFFTSQVGATKIDGTKNPFLDACADPLCKLNLKETSDIVKTFPLSNNGSETRDFLEISTKRCSKDNNNNKRHVEAPPTPGRPIFSFSNGSFSRKSFPSKWDDAEKWVVSGSSCNDSPAQGHLPFEPTSKMFSRQCSGYKPKLGEIITEKPRVGQDNVSQLFSTCRHHNSSGAINVLSLSAPADDLALKDKLPNPSFGCSEPMQEGFLFENAVENSITNDASVQVVHDDVKHRDIGTEMTPLGSSTTSRCPTPFMSTSPARHNTPTNRSGPLPLTSIDSSKTIDIAQLQECHLAKLHLDSVSANWSSREEEEEDVSKSLRHFEMNSECRISVSEKKFCTWEEEEKTKSCLRYQREEAKIQAWVNLQSAKAEAESRKLEVKIQKMRSNMEEKLMKKMAEVSRKAEEWRAAAQFQHSEQIRKARQQSRKMMKQNNSHLSGHNSCGCFPCNNNNHMYLV